MNLFDILSLIPAFVILVTAVARLNDIKRTQNSKRWWIRRVGLLFVSVSMVMFVASYFTIGTPYWNLVMKFLGLWGFALTWLTTPNMKPWWQWISRYDEKNPE